MKKTARWVWGSLWQRAPRCPALGTPLLGTAMGAQLPPPPGSPHSPSRSRWTLEVRNTLIAQNLLLLRPCGSCWRRGRWRQGGLCRSWAGWLRFCAFLLAPGLTFNLLAFQYLGLFDVMGHFVQLSPTTGYSLSAAKECEEFHGEEDETFRVPSGGNYVWAGDIVMFSVRRQLPALGACTLSFHLAKTFSFGL